MLQQSLDAVASPNSACILACWKRTLLETVKRDQAMPERQTKLSQDDNPNPSRKKHVAATYLAHIVMHMLFDTQPLWWNFDPTQLLYGLGCPASREGSALLLANTIH